MRNLTNKYGPSGKFAVVTNYSIQGLAKKNEADILLKLKDYVKKHKINYAVYNGLRLSACPGNGNLSYAALVNPEGKLIIDGNMLKIEEEILSILMDNMSIGTLICEGLDIKLLQKEVEKLELGKPLDGVLRDLQRLVDKKAASATEAESIIKAIQSWGEKRLTKSQADFKETPAKAYMHMEGLSKTYQSTDLGKKIKDELSKWKRDRELIQLVEARTSLLKIQEKGRGSVRGLMRSLKKIIDSNKASEPLKKEAAELLESAQKIE